MSLGFTLALCARPFPLSSIDNVFGDRNLVSSCIGMEAYAS